MVIEKFVHGSFDKQTSSTVQVYCAFSIHKIKLIIHVSELLLFW